MSRRKEQRLYKEWLDLCDTIKLATESIPVETEKEKDKRKKRLRMDFNEFCKYYFGNHYMKDPFAWFHLSAAQDITEDPGFFGTLEWPREHAKSVFLNVMMPLWLYARGELQGMITVSANEDKAKTLLADLQAEFVSNKRWINDYGELARFGDWRDGAFSTTDGYGFWAFGRGQSPRGTRKAQHRPNYAVVDDIDDKVIVKNQQRVKEAVNWILEDLYGALSIKGARLVIAGNRIHKYSILSHIVGDVEPDDVVNPDRYHSKVYAIENSKHEKADPEDGRPAWKERYTIAQLVDKMDKMGFYASRREYFHEHHEEGNTFKKEWINFKKCLHWSKYDEIIVYCDPSFKSSKTSDYKAIVALGVLGTEIHGLTCWIRKASVSAMVNRMYDYFETYENHARYYIEANMLQDLLLDDFYDVGVSRGYQMPIRGDKRKKPNKESRIEAITPLFERGVFYFNEDEKQRSDMKQLIKQFKGFPYGHDDGPDATEGGIHYLQSKRKGKPFLARTGNYNTQSKRWINT